MFFIVILCFFSFFYTAAMQQAFTEEMKYDFSRMYMQINTYNDTHSIPLKIKNYEKKRIVCLYKSISEKNIDMFKKKLPRDVNTNKTYSNLLIDLISSQFTEGIKFLLQTGFSPNQGTVPPLRKGIFENNFEICKLLLSYKADPNVWYNNFKGERVHALHAALIEHKQDMVELLLQYEADPNVLSAINLREISDFYLHYADNPSTEKTGYSALQIAVLLKYDASIIDMLLRCGADPNKKTAYVTPLNYAIIQVNQTTNITIEVIKKLILAGARLDIKILVKTDIDNVIHKLTPYEWAIKLGKHEIAQLLANSDMVFKEEAYKKFGVSIFKRTFLGQMYSSNHIKKFSKK